MTFLNRVRIPCILLVVLAAAAAQAQAIPNASVAPTPAPALSSGTAWPEAPVNTAPVAVPVPRPVAGRSSGVAGRSSGVESYNMLLSDPTNANLPMTERVLVIPGKPMSPQAIDQAVEDLSVMSRIIQKDAVGDYQGGTLGNFGVGNGFVFGLYPDRNDAGPGLFFPATGRPKPMYLGGYGAVFFMQVGYPLLPPPQAPQAQPANPQEDPVWSEAKRSVFEPQARPGVPQEPVEAAEPYSREQVDALRTALIGTMKHAANIRVLEPTEGVTIVVQGAAPAGPQPGQGTPGGSPTEPGVAAGTGRTMLTLRASKADVDQYAKGQLSQPQFEQRVQIATY